MPRPVTQTALPALPALLAPPALLVLLALHARAVPLGGEGCGARAQLAAGWLCGRADNRTRHASFLGVPYARQPVGVLRFKELQTLEPWDGFYDATVEGPICPQHDIVYGSLNRGTGMDEACIYANIHVPLHALPEYKMREFQPPYKTGSEKPGLPILVFIHGGGFAYGSGGIGLHGPEYLMPKDVIVITFNYRLNVFGFLSLNSSHVPGNNGLRDMVTLLHWVQDNARSFGGNPDDVTIAGQSAGAASAHLLTLSKAAEGLFNRAILMSGDAISTFYTTSPIYAQFVANMFLTMVGINSTNPEEVHQKLIDLPIDVIMEANKQIQNIFGLTAFFPVVESSFPGVTMVLDNDPELLISGGRGDNIPLIIGFTDAECETFRSNFEEIGILERIKENPLILLPVNSIYNLPPDIALSAAKKVEEHYFNDEPSLDEYVHFCSDIYYKYPAIKLAMKRAEAKGAPAFLYEFSYQADFSVIKDTKGLHFKGAGHIEDLLFLFRARALDGVKGYTPPSRRDQSMIDWMTTFVKNFMYSNDPACNQGLKSPWPSVTEGPVLHYQIIEQPMVYQYTPISKEQKQMVRFFDNLQNFTSEI